MAMEPIASQRAIVGDGGEGDSEQGQKQADLGADVLEQNHRKLGLT